MLKWNKFKNPYSVGSIVFRLKYMVKLFAKTELMVQFYKNRTHGSIVTIEPTKVPFVSKHLGTDYKSVPARGI